MSGFEQTRTGGVVAALAGVALTVTAIAFAAPVQAQDKLILGEIPFPCALNNFAKTLCAGFEAGAEELPEGYAFELKTGLDFGDTASFNNIIETSLQLNPAGLIIFPNGSSAQVPLLRRACEQGAKIVIIDNPVEGLGECQTGYVAADHGGLGALLGEWLIENPPTSKKVGIVTLQPGQVASNDARVSGFKQVVENAGFEIVAEVVTDLSLDRTRTQVTNMLTAHPDIGAVLSANDQIGNGTAQAIDDPNIVQLSIDGAMDSVERIVDGNLSADAAQDPFNVARLAVINIAKAIEGEDIPTTIAPEGLVVDASNVEAYLDAGGMQGMVDGE
ncbi:sugar ABC transporter substrate-binding protein [Pelagibacterium sp.]|uniref:sugar ABC transporter substrate-binding protein n=1 Tax=Pelagibacterium sp. TaxID=1967288 RepID=UPI003BAAA104